MGGQRPSQDPQGSIWASSEAAATWREGAAARERAFGPATERLLERAGIGPGMRVLDIAAGTGDQAFVAAGRDGPTGSVLATDISAGMLAAAAEGARQAGLHNVQTRVMDAQRLDLEEGTFDAAIARFGLMFMPDLQDALVGIRRALAPGGRFAALVWSTPERNPLYALPMAIARAYVPDTAPRPDIFGLGDARLLEDAFERAGFVAVAVEAIALELRAPSVAAFVEGQRGTHGPMATILALVGEDDRPRLRAEVAAALRRFEGPDGLAAPGEALIAVGTR